MGFDRFGIVSSTADSRVSKFIDNLDEGKITATQCQKCGAKYFPPQADCSKCLSSQMEWFEIDPRGSLLSYTLVRYGPAGFENQAPYAIGVGEFDDGLKTLGLLSKEIPQDDIKVGMKLKIVPVKLDGNRVSYQFEKA